VDEDGEASDAIAPRGIVVVGVHEPVTVPAAPTEDGDTEEQKYGGETIAEEGATDQLHLELKDPGERDAKEEGDHEKLANCGDNKGNNGEHLDDDEPPGRHPFSDESKLISVCGVAAVPQFVELEVREPVVVEAKLPEPHVLEGRLSVGPGLEPVWRGEAHHQEHKSNEGGDGRVH